RALQSYSGRSGDISRDEWRSWAESIETGRALLAQACSETLETAQKGQAGVLERRDEALAALPLFAPDAALPSRAAGRALALLIPQIAGPKDADKLSAFLDALPSDAREGGAGAVAGALRAADAAVAPAAARAVARGSASIPALAELVPAL